MSDQALVGPNLEGPETSLLLGTLEPLLDMPPGKRRGHHLLDVRRSWDVADPVLDLVRLGVLRDNQPVRAVGRNGDRSCGVRQVHSGSLGIPDGRSTRGLFDG